MRKYRLLITVLAVLMGLLVSSLFSAEMWRLDKEGQWETISDEDKYLMAVAEIKKLVNMGETEAVQNAVNELQNNFPEIAGPDLDAFMKAEMLYSKGKFTKAVRSYDKFLAEYPSSEFYEAALSRQFAIATAFLGGQKKSLLGGVVKLRGYEEGSKIMAGITDRAGDSPIAVKAAVAVAQSLEERSKYEQAYNKWAEISSRWPVGQVGRDAALAMARCKHASYRGPKFDAAYLISAKSYYESFKLRYPAEADELGIDGILEQISEQLAYKQFNVGRYYQQIGNIQSANVYYQMVIDNWPGSTAAQMARQAMNQGRSDAEKGEKWQENIMDKFEKLLL